MSSLMTKGEREELQRLVRQREKVMKSAAKQRSRELLADFENQISAEYAFDDDKVWAEAVRIVEPEIKKAQEAVARRCVELGIPRQFAPKLGLTWANRSYHSSVKERREELRLAAKAQVAALESKAVVQIELQSVEAQTQIAMAGLTSEAAHAFLATLPSVDSLMPELSYEAIAGESDPPIIEQILTPNAIRQRRYREKQKALRDSDVTLPSVADESQADA
ncbi:hypothetical protein LPJGGPFB_05651 [Ensifer adhaerens]|uniref:hypothetical protein n=1 Tax=Ensifer adhaerens TaxID=106592 RepID=UPI001569F894|nr:hypothetical protein [Ensifer adhaerens]NRP22392.1 hypothetical protein [Ensifer adhaerens]